MATLILTEKPSVAMDFAKALGVSGKQDGYIDGGQTLITWAVGHLVELFEPQDYDPAWKKWSLSSLPILPAQVKYKPLAKTKKQLAVIRGLLKRPDIDRVVIATDAGREGEVIARTILLAAGYTKKNVYRFWTSQALTPEVVREGMKHLKPAGELDRLWNAGQARQVSDWLVGMNGTRAASVTFGAGSLYSVGRVQTPVLAMLVDRRREREHFKPEPYWVLRARFTNPKGSWWGTWFAGDEVRFNDEAKARAVKASVEGKPCVVESVKRERKKQAPPLLYSLTDLQQDANRKFGFPAQKTLDVAQRLYEEKKCLSYPRTDAKVLGTKTVGLVKEVIGKLKAGRPELFKGMDPGLWEVSNRRVYNDAKLTDHHALMPLAPLPAGASADEQKLFELVLKRFAAAFHPDCDFEATQIVTAVGAARFRTKGSRIITPGWKAVYGAEALSPQNASAKGDEPEESDLPALAPKDKGEVAETACDRKETTPPPEYTEALLLKDMTNPSRYVTEEELKKIYRGDVGLGTQATRAAVIETLLARDYVERRKKHLVATDKGCFLIETLRGAGAARALTSPEETARWEMRLEAIAQGEGSGPDFLGGIRSFVQSIVEELKMTKTEAPAAGQETLGTCPACGGGVIEGKKGYGCSNWREENGGCRFVVWKEIAGKTLSTSTVSELLEKRQCATVEGFTSKAGKTFSAPLKLIEEEGKWQVKFDFESAPKDGAPGGEKSPKDEKPLGACPACGGGIVEGQKGYGCSNWREQDGGCRFTIWKTVAGKTITRATAQKLLKGQTVGPMEGFKSKAGKSFSAKLKLEEGKVAFEFDDAAPGR